MMKAYLTPTVSMENIQAQDILTLSLFDTGSSMWYDLENRTSSKRYR